MDEEHYSVLNIVPDRSHVLGGEAGSCRERGAYQDQDQESVRHSVNPSLIGSIFFALVTQHGASPCP